MPLLSVDQVVSEERCDSTLTQIRGQGDVCSWPKLKALWSQSPERGGTSVNLPCPSVPPGNVVVLRKAE